VTNTAFVSGTIKVKQSIWSPRRTPRSAVSSALWGPMRFVSDSLLWLVINKWLCSSN